MFSLLNNRSAAPRGDLLVLCSILLGHSMSMVPQVRVAGMCEGGSETSSMCGVSISNC